LDGEALTLDWSLDHPHHRGVYWAWPEVDYRGQRGDLHALQRVFARPTGKIAVRHEPGAVEIEAENHWLWDDKTPIVREAATIRVHRAGAYGRHIDLKLVFTALGDDVAIARRGATAYGGLNLRFSPIGKLDLVKHIDPEAAAPRRAWADAVGERAGGKGPSGVAILPRATNPAYPDDWIDFPALPWLQPAFPSPGVRWVLKKDTPLVLEYRLWVHRGGKQPDAVYREQWEAYNER
jgi:hypothetical protein